MQPRYSLTGNHHHPLPTAHCNAFLQRWALNCIIWGKHLLHSPFAADALQKLINCCCTTCSGPCLAPASPHLCWQGISCALRQISKQPGSLLRSASGKRQCFMFSVTLAWWGGRGSMVTVTIEVGAILISVEGGSEGGQSPVDLCALPMVQFRRLKRIQINWGGFVDYTQRGK